ncbi:HAF repeat/PEP-CTERM domain-containing protein [Fischerella sp. PCC 9605]|uniref:HAF repeat/PEP-CTERM domain-containing protein n=1 Tax=Fischerella sp. PCC 9605 TaxID=1173024 RepID=UPI00047C6E54|nr:HAF repeat/PEP-CTERM domain-containing protein [Fischerella sp. PCC 9605]
MKSITSLKTKVKTKVKKLTVLLGSAAVMTLGVNASATAASLYDVTILSDLESAYFGKNVRINNFGQVVGTSNSSNGARASLWSSSTGTINLGTLPGGTYSEAIDINDAGQVAGISSSSDGDRHFLWSSSTGMVDFSTLSGLNSNTPHSITAINNTGQVVGNIKKNDDSYSPFLWSNNTGTVELDVVGDGYNSYSKDINDVGQIVGTYSRLDGSGVSKGFLWNNNEATDLSEALDAYVSEPSSINNFGQVVGTYTPSWTEEVYEESSLSRLPRAFLWSSSTGKVDIGVDEFNKGIYSVPLDVNDLGQVVGSTFGGDWSDAFFWDSSTGWINLNTVVDPSLGWTIEYASDINNKGQIIAFGNNKNGRFGTVLLTPKSHKPVPEPLTMGGTVLAGAGLAYLRRRQGRLRRSSKA